jgi:hypothetical protein
MTMSFFDFGSAIDAWQHLEEVKMIISPRIGLNVDFCAACKNYKEFCHGIISISVCAIPRSSLDGIH